MICSIKELSNMEILFRVDMNKTSFAEVEPPPIVRRKPATLTDFGTVTVDFDIREIKLNEPYIWAVANPVNAMSSETFYVYAQHIVNLIMKEHTINGLVTKVTIDQNIPYKTTVSIDDAVERERLYKEGSIIDVMEYIKNPKDID